MDCITCDIPDVNCYEQCKESELDKNELDEVMEKIIEKLNMVLNFSIEKNLILNIANDKSISEIISNLVSAYEKLHNIKEV